MIVKHITEDDFDRLRGVKFDLCICASGYETRARHVAEQLGISPKRRVAFGFLAHQDAIDRPINDATYGELNYEMVGAAGNSGDEIRSLLREHLRGISNKSGILVDITSMTRYWYATLLDEIRRTQLPEEVEIAVYFTYVPSVYEPPPQDQPPNVSVGPVLGFSAIELPDLPTAVVLGLGHEPGKALGIAEYIDGRELYAFMTNPAFDKRFSRDVLKMNTQLIERLSDGHLVEYPLPSVTTTALLLNSLVDGLVRTHRVILVPFGPKIFSLLCFLLALRRPEVSVWRVSSEEEELLAKRPPVNRVLVCRVDFSSQSPKRAHLS